MVSDNGRCNHLGYGLGLSRPGRNSYRPDIRDVGAGIGSSRDTWYGCRTRRTFRVLLADAARSDADWGGGVRGQSLCEKPGVD